MCLVNSKINNLPTFKCKQNFKLGCLKVWSTLPGYFNCLLTKNQQIGQSHGTRSMCFAEVRPEWGQKEDLSDSEAEARLSRGFQGTIISWVSTERSQKEKTGSERAAVRRRLPYWSMSGVREQRADRPQRGHRDSSDHWLRAGKDRTRFLTKQHNPTLNDTQSHCPCRLQPLSTPPPGGSLMFGWVLQCTPTSDKPPPPPLPLLQSNINY